MFGSQNSLNQAPVGSEDASGRPQATGPWQNLKATAAPTMLMGLIAFGVILLRPGLPIDETRYLEVLREHLGGSVLVLHLMGEPYAEKPPLLFWLARLLVGIGIPLDTALRSIPALSATLTIPLVARIGRRAGVELAGWMQATLFLPFLVGQLLFFDSLLALGVWAALDAWTRGRDRWTTAAAAFALLAKGPVALLFLGPFLWSLAPLRPSRTSPSRAAAVLTLACLPLLLWALAAALAGGPDFARALFWERWAGRVVGDVAHSRFRAFYLPVALVGALPGTLLLLRGGSSSEPWTGRTVRVLLGLLLVFTLIKSKQAHYLVPAAPAVALLCAWQLQREARNLRLLRIGVALVFLLWAAVVVALLLHLDELRELSSAAGRVYLNSGAARLMLLIALLSTTLGAMIAFVRQRTATALLATLLISTGIVTLSLHRLAGFVLFPAHLKRSLTADRTQPLALFGSARHGLYWLLSGRDRIERLADIDQLDRWIRDNPKGLAIVDQDRLEDFVPDSIPPGMTLLVEDAVHGDTVLVFRSEATSR